MAQQIEAQSLLKEAIDSLSIATVGLFMAANISWQIIYVKLIQGKRESEALKLLEASEGK